MLGLIGKCIELWDYWQKRTFEMGSVIVYLLCVCMCGTK